MTEETTDNQTPPADAPAPTEGTPAEAPAEATPAAVETSAAAPEAPAPDAPASEASESKEQPAEADAAAEVPAASADAEAAPSADASADAPAEQAAEGEGKKKKKRRRKKKKKPEGERKVQPFTHLFEGSPRAHAFRVGEVIAGRVQSVDDGAIVVDLFGKALAIADVMEPREIPPAPVPENTEATVPGSEAAPEGEAVEATPDVSPAVEAESVSVTEAQPTEAEAPAVEAPAPDVTTAVETESVSVSEAASQAPEVAPSEAPEAAPSEAEVAQAAPSEAPEAAAEPEPEPPPLPDVGTIFRGRIGAVAESGHIAIVNRNIDRAAAKAKIAEAREARRRVFGVVYGFNRGGFDVLVEGIRAFCPAGGMSLEQPITDPAAHLGKKLEFTVPINKGSGKSIIVSRRGILERELRKKARARLKELTVGQQLEGPVTEVRDYGLLVDLGEGLEGLVHQSEIGWSRGQKTSDAAKVGDVVKVEVLKIQAASRKDRQGRVSLSMRKCMPDPWDDHADKLKAGSIHQGIVRRTAEFGAFVEILPGIEGLLHISELGGRDIKHAKQVLSEGDELEVLVERLDKKERRISLSKLSPADKAAIESGEWDPTLAPKTLKPGALVKVVVTRIENHGVLATIQGVLGKRGRAYIPNRELPVEGPSRKKAYAPGTEHEVKIIGKDRDGQLKCSIKAKLNDEERRAVKEYRKEASKQGFGTFGDLLKAKLGDKN